MSAFEFYFPHQNLGCLGIRVFGKYIDISLPPREGWGWNWTCLVRVYWRQRDGRHYLLLPGCRHATPDKPRSKKACGAA